ncbi:hypothetical protein Bbelb_105630 [Branchiostoma belcheri]|nr:hypothetical protein Bbelb_105630 [Branchiostoma belcheri]
MPRECARAAAPLGPTADSPSKAITVYTALSWPAIRHGEGRPWDSSVHGSVHVPDRDLDRTAASRSLVEARMPVYRSVSPVSYNLRTESICVPLFGLPRSPHTTPAAIDLGSDADSPAYLSPMVYHPSRL